MPPTLSRSRPPDSSKSPRRLPLLLLPLIAGLPSCGLIKAPFKIAGGVVSATADVAYAAVEKPIDGHRKRKARRAEKQKLKDAEEEKQAQTETGTTPAASSTPLLTDPLPSDPLPTDPLTADPPLPSDPSLSSEPALPEYDSPPP